MRPDEPEKRALRHEKKWLRLDSTDTQCGGCGRLVDFRSLWKAADGAPICHNCRKARKSYSAATAAQRLKTLQGAGYSSPTCLVCHEGRVETLELHHIAGEANSGLVAPLCANCHAIQSDEQEDLPIDLRRPDPDRRPLVLQAAFDFGLAILAGAAALTSEDPTEAAFLGMIAVALVAWAIYNIAADQHFAENYGADYHAGVMAPVPG